MKRSFPRPALILGLLAAAACAACSFSLGVPGNGTLAGDPRPVRGFSRVVLRAPLDASVREGQDFNVTVWVDQNLQDLVTTKVSGDTLIIDVTESVDPQREARVDIALPRLDGFRIEGAADASIAGAPSHQAVQLAIDGSGEITYSGGAELMQASISGSGEIKLTGEARQVTAEIDGSGSIDARAMPATGGRFSIDGSGDILADLRGGEVSCAISGSGDIHWEGTARVTSLEISGSGSVGPL